MDEIVSIIIDIAGGGIVFVFDQFQAQGAKRIGVLEGIWVGLQNKPFWDYVGELGVNQVVVGLHGLSDQVLRVVEAALPAGLGHKGREICFWLQKLGVVTTTKHMIKYYEAVSQSLP